MPVPKTISVCIVEDTRSIRTRVAARLTAMPQVEIVGIFEDALSALEGLPQLNPQLTIMDIGLPKMKGTEVMARLIDQGFTGDFIMFTVFDDDEYLFGALTLGAVGYVLKEDRAAGVQKAVEEYLLDGSHMSRSVARRVLQNLKDRNTITKESVFEEFTDHQLKITKYLAEGLSNKVIADRLGITIGTVKQNIHRIYRKLGVNNRAEAVAKYVNQKK